MTQNRWWTLAALGALAVVGLYTAVRSAASVDACGNPCGGTACSAPAACCPAPACCPVPACCPAPVESKATQSAAPKQHFRFVLDNLSFRMGNEGECKIKRIEFEYKGDGIEAEVAKTALTAGNAETSASKVELGELTKLLEKLLETQTGQKAMLPTCGMLPVPVPSMTLPSGCYLAPAPVCGPMQVCPAPCVVPAGCTAAPCCPSAYPAPPATPEKPTEDPTDATDDGCAD